MQEEKQVNENQSRSFEIELGESVTLETLLTDKIILFKKQVQQQIDEFAASDTSRELGGVLLGIPEEKDEGLCLSITAMLKAKKTAANKTSITFTHETWDQIHREKEILYPELKIVGWFHTHPGFGVFLSNYDLFIQQNFFNLPWQVAYVVDPVNQEKGFFAWEDQQIKPSPYQVTDKGQAVMVSLPKEEAETVTEAEQVPDEPRKGNNWYKVMLIVMIIFLAATNLHRFRGPETDQEQEETLLAKERQVEMLLSELNHQEEKVVSLQSEIQRLEESVNRLSGEYFYVYTVMPGDTLWSISSRFYGDPGEYQFLMRLNNLDDPDSLEVGQMLLLYKQGD